MRKSINIRPSNEFASALSDYLDYCRSKNLSPHTIGYYHDRIRLFFSYSQQQRDIHRPQDITPATVRAFITYSLDSGYSEKTTNHGVIALKGFFRFMVEENRLPVSPTDRIRLIKMEKKLIQTFTDAQVQAMLDWCDRRTFIGLRNYTIILTLLDTGLRVSELCGLRGSSIDWSNCFFRVLGKGGKERMVPFGRCLCGALRDYLKRTNDVGDDHVFLNHYGEPMERRVVRRALIRIGADAQITGVRVSPHTFRHTFAKNWVISGGDPFSLQRILGHTTQEMVSQYVNLAVGDLQAQHSKFSFADRLMQPNPPRNVVLR